MKKLILLVPLIIGGCDVLEGGCESKQDKARSVWGEPSRFTSFSAGDDYKSETYYWNDIGRAETFVWGRDVNGCDTLVSNVPPY